MERSVSRPSIWAAIVGVDARTAVGRQTLEDGASSAACSIAAPTGSSPGFGLPDAQGNWTGLDVDFCRAIAAAIFNDPPR